MAAERSRATMLDRRHHLELVETQMPLMGRAVSRPRGTEDGSDLK